MNMQQNLRRLATHPTKSISKRSIPLITRKTFALSLVLIASLAVVTGCKKKPVQQAATPPAATTPAPTAQLTATPSTITAGDQVVLSWKTVDANSVSIDGMGAVPSSGVKTVTPTMTTTYHLTARGDGGSTDATATVTVNPAQAAVAVPENNQPMTAEQMFKANVQDIFFDYDSYDVRTGDEAVLSKAAAFLAAHPEIKVLIGGYCDERGSNEYNLALGENRANAAKKLLVQDGVSPNRLRVVSYGKERPFCTESTESCWQQNRRAGFSIDGTTGN